MTYITNNNIYKTQEACVMSREVQDDSQFRDFTEPTCL